jgi:SAM-dependent MidA family methyltransferase
MAEITRRGPITFAEYMDAALYHPEHGYYASRSARTGRAGHFMTSPEIDASFGELWAGAFARVWDACERPHLFDVVEIGPGEGAFAHAVLRAATGGFAAALRYVLVEPRPAARTRQRETIADDRTEWVESLAETSCEAGCVFANEILDNQPVHLVRPGRDGPNEVFVAAVDKGLDLVDGPVSSPAITGYLREVGVDENASMQVGLAGADLARAAAAGLTRGALFFVDYGLEADEIRRRGGNTVVTYSERGAGTDPLFEPGLADVTAHVDWTGTRLALQSAGLDVAGPWLQADVLGSLGAREIDGRLRGEHAAALEAGDGVTAVRMLSRRNALATLTNTGGLGGLQVLVAAKNLSQAPASLVRA